MNLISASIGGWTIKATAAPTPFHVELIGPDRQPQVVDSRGIAALSGPGGAIFCASIEQANQLCQLANEGQLRR